MKSFRKAKGPFLSIAWVVLCSAARLWSAPPQTDHRPVVLKGATIIDVLGGQAIVDSTIVIEGERVKSVLRGGNSIDPGAATVVDLRGKYIIPGLFDSHVHWSNWMGELYLNHGVTSILALADVAEPEKSAFQASLTAPRVFHSGGRLQATPETTDEQIRQAIRVWLSKAPDIAWLTELGRNNREIYRRIAEQVNREGFLVFSHAQNAPDGIESGMGIAEHIWGFGQAMMNAEELETFQRGRLPTWATFLKDSPRLDQMVRNAVARGIYLNPTLVYEWGGLSVSTARREQDAHRLFGNPELAYFQPDLAGALLIHHRQIKNFSARYEHWPMLSKVAPEDLDQFREGYRNVQRFVRRWVQEGGKIAAGTDAGSVAIPGLGMHHEMELLVEAGLTPMQALQAATSWPAEILAGKNGARGGKAIGAIEAGYFADLIVLSADPLQDITNTRKIERVMKGGQFVQLGYHPEYATTVPAAVGQSAPTPEISSITPNAVPEGSPGFSMLIEGVGFTGTAVVRVDGISVETQFEGPRKLRAKIPANVVARALPDRFASPGPEQKIGIFGDRTVRITVYNPTPAGGLSNSVALRVLAKWE